MWSTPTAWRKFVRSGCLVLDFPGTNRDTVLGMLADVGIDFEELTPDQIKARWPALDVGDYWPPKPIDDPAFADDAHGVTRRLLHARRPGSSTTRCSRRATSWLRRRHHGATLLLKSEVIEIRRQGGRVQGITLASGERIDAPVVVNVGGPHSLHLNRMAGVADEMRIKHRPMRQEVHVADCSARTS